MPLLSLILNILWVLTGGLWMAAAWLLAALLMVVSIIGIPWARSALTIAWYALLPFGQTAVRRDEFRGREDIGTGALGFLGNVVWFVFAGWWLALGHLITAAGLAITIIGIPWAWAHLKLALLALWPVGTEIVTTDEMDMRRRAMGRY
ncbi:YccF domain-containing protein [Azospirillum thermophilum]|uniref:Inner membrane protein YccF n=1 Tax=Azospirillum thermophilum TaxID=2202148 RepID=A0A2S2CT28_9PROT|nr:YccF domain-containing protein [Azospirillum thermophilum]AWK87540.1 YccF domain-containing protein [Azospirillum thermophilum]